MKNTGLVLGKFYPPHKGHLHLIKYAEEHSPGGLIVVVGSLANEAISPKLRVKWLQKMVGENTLVVNIPDDSPDGLPVANVKATDEDYYITWRNNLLTHLPYRPKTIYGSEAYIKKLSYYMGMKYKIVDLDRKIVPVSASMIRNNPELCWEYIPDVVKPYYRKLMRDFIKSAS